MGRLTLNVLLSFAQFEREVTGERIRDKIAASKRKGMWMGGVPPFGYDICERRLVINQPRRLRSDKFSSAIWSSARYGCLKEDLDRRGVASKPRVAKRRPLGRLRSLPRRAL